jgi:hypothetical protein
VEAVGDISGAHFFVAYIAWTGHLDAVRKSLEQLFLRVYRLDRQRGGSTGSLDIPDFPDGVS